jgi:hypothetical protein
MAKKTKESPAKKAALPRAGEPVYTMMAFISLVAIIIGCALLYMDFEDYGKQAAPTEKVPTLPKLGEEQKGSPLPAGPAAPVAAPGGAGAPMPPPGGAGAPMPPSGN